MPTYEYRCDSCSRETETFQKITDDPLKKCPNCGQESLIRLPGGGIGLFFKGSGFYSTDYGSKPDKTIESKNNNSKGKDACPCGSESKCSSGNS